MGTYTLDDHERAEARKFIDEHEARHGRSRAVDGARYTYAFTPSGLGISVWIRCSCKQAVDITDYSEW